MCTLYLSAWRKSHIARENETAIKLTHATMALKQTTTVLLRMFTILGTLGAIAGGIWAAVPYIVKTQSIYNNIDPLLHAVEDMHEILELATTNNATINRVSVDLVRVKAQNKQLKNLIEYNKEIAKDVMMGHAPFDSIWHKDDFGWNKVHVRTYFIDSLYLEWKEEIS